MARRNDKVSTTSFRFTDAQYRKLSYLADVMGISRGEVVRRLLDAVTVQDIVRPVREEFRSVTVEGLGND